MSNTPYENDVLEQEAVLNATYHDVQIKQVQIINPSNGTVKFKDYESVSLHSEPFIPDSSHQKKVAKLVTDNEDSCFDKGNNSGTPTDADAHGNFSVHVMNVPLGTDQLDTERKSRSAVQYRQKQTVANDQFGERRRKHKDELMQRKQQIIQSLNQYERRSSTRSRGEPTQFFEVAPGVVIPERPISGVGQSPDLQNTYEQQLHQIRLTTAPRSGRQRIWTGHRSASSRGLSTVSSSRWKLDVQSPPKPNVFVKMPFKQTPVVTMSGDYRPEDDLISPGEELRIATAFTVSRVRHAIKKMSDPGRPDSRQGRLLKGRLKPLRPVPLRHPNIHTCQGIQPESRAQGCSPSPSRLRHLKEQYLEVCQMHQSSPIEDEYERRMRAQSVTPIESIHRTSPQPEEDVDLEHEGYPVNQQSDVLLKKIDERDELEATSNDAYDYETFARQITPKPLEQHFDAMRLESGVIY